jgi:serine/threonine-protein kinase HipA
MLGKSDSEKENAISSIISVGTSAGGQRPKAVLAIHPVTKRIVSGQISAPKGYEHWLLKFDGVVQSGVASGAGVRIDPQGYGIVEYAYHMMAKACGITMMECQLLTENGRSHFMTRRFDRTPDGEKIHILSLCGMAHFDYRKAGYYSYEQLFEVMRTIRLPHSDAIEQYKRMIFNVVARNQDDHTKNIAFILDKKGVWRLSPAFDLTYSHNPGGEWTSAHQMTLAGKRDHFIKEDLLNIGKSISIPKPSEIIEQIIDTVAGFKNFAATAGLDKKKTKTIENELRLKW